MNRILITASLALSLFGCAATPDLPSTYTLDAGLSEGLAIVSLTMSGKPLNTVSSFEYRIREVPPRNGEEVAARPYFTSVKQHAKWVRNGGGHRKSVWNAVVKELNATEPLDIFDAGKAVGRLISMRLPAGEYEFYAWLVRVPNQYGGTEYGPRQAFSYRFNVKPGEAVYLGRLNLHLSERDTHRITVEDQGNSDLAIFREKYPGLGTSRIASEIGKIQL